MRIAMIGQKGLGAGAKTGGVEKHVRELASRLVQRGHDVTVYARRKYHPKKPKRLLGVRLVYVPTIYTKNLETFFYSLFSTVSCLLSPVSYDIIHYHGVGPATLAWIPRLFSPKTTVIVTFHSQDQFHQKWGWFARRYLAFGERAATWFPHYCIAVSHALQVYCRDTFNREVVFIPNGAEIKSSDGDVEVLGLEPKRYILNVGRLVPQKGIQFLIEAFSNIKTDMQLAIVGASGFSQQYERRLRSLAKGDHRIHFLGFRSGVELDALYANAYLYCHPSESEGLPLTILEAMSFGIAPLVSDIAPNVEAIHGAGVTFESGNTDDLQRKLERLLSDSDMVDTLGADAKHVIQEYFNWDVITERTEEVYVTARH